MYLFVEILDFFGFYTRDQYSSYAVFIFLGLSVIISILCRRPTNTILVNFPHKDFSIEVRIGDLFDAAGAVMISTNTLFEADVAGKKISPNSLQGQFTAKYYTGSQVELIEALKEGMGAIDGSPPYPLGTVIPITTHGKTFYFCAMADLNEQGNASSTLSGVKQSLEGLWAHVRESGELQELAVPLIGTGRGRLQIPRKKMIEIVAESFVAASREGVFADRLVIAILPSDANKFEINLWEVKDHLKRALIV
jgi:hypothetical protein